MWLLLLLQEALQPTFYQVPPLHTMPDYISLIDVIVACSVPPLSLPWAFHTCLWNVILAAQPDINYRRWKSNHILTLLILTEIQSSGPVE